MQSGPKIQSIHCLQTALTKMRLHKLCTLAGSALCTANTLLVMMNDNKCTEKSCTRFAILNAHALIYKSLMTIHLIFVQHPLTSITCCFAVSARVKRKNVGGEKCNSEA